MNVQSLHTLEILSHQVHLSCGLVKDNFTSLADAIKDRTTMAITSSETESVSRSCLWMALVTSFALVAVTIIDHFSFAVRAGQIENSSLLEIVRHEHIIQFNVETAKESLPRLYGFVHLTKPH